MGLCAFLYRQIGEAVFSLKPGSKGIGNARNQAARADDYLARGDDRMWRRIVMFSQVGAPAKPAANLLAAAARAARRQTSDHLHPRHPRLATGQPPHRRNSVA